MKNQNPKSAVLELRDVVKTYEMGNEQVHALSGVSLDIGVLKQTEYRPFFQQGQQACVST